MTREPIHLARNESSQPLNPEWLKAAYQALTSINRYPDPECSTLRAAIAARFELEPARIAFGAGLFELLQRLAFALLRPGDDILIPEHAFFFFRHISDLAGAGVKTAPETNFKVDVSGLLSAVTPNTRMVMVANPANPTGTYIRKSELLSLREQLPAGVLLVIDEAYAEFVDPVRYEALFDVPDLITLRTFSKMYGLAGCRIAWGYLPHPIVSEVRRFQPPAIVNSIGQALAASAVQDFFSVARYRELLNSTKSSFLANLAACNGVTVIPSETNFVLLALESHRLAMQLETELRMRGIVVNSEMPEGLKSCLRVTIGTPQQMGIVASVIGSWSGTRTSVVRSS